MPSCWRPHHVYPGCVATRSPGSQHSRCVVHRMSSRRHTSKVREATSQSPVAAASPYLVVSQTISRSSGPGVWPPAAVSTPATLHTARPVGSGSTGGNPPPPLPPPPHYHLLLSSPSRPLKLSVTHARSPPAIDARAPPAPPQRASWLYHPPPCNTPHPSPRHTFLIESRPEDTR